MATTNVQETQNPSSGEAEATDLSLSMDARIFMLLGKLDERTKTVVDSLGSLSGKIDDTNTKIDNLDKELSGKIDATNTRIDTTNTRIDETNTRIDNLDKELSGKIDATNTKVSELNKELSIKIDGQLERIHSSEKIISSGKALLVVIGVAIGMLWTLLGPRITEVLGIGAHKTPVEQTAVEKTVPH